MERQPVRSAHRSDVFEERRRRRRRLAVASHRMREMARASGVGGRFVAAALGVGPTRRRLPIRRRGKYSSAASTDIGGEKAAATLGRSIIPPSEEIAILHILRPFVNGVGGSKRGSNSSRSRSETRRPRKSRMIRKMALASALVRRKEPPPSPHPPAPSLRPAAKNPPKNPALQLRP